MYKTIDFMKEVNGLELFDLDPCCDAYVFCFTLVY